MKKRVSRQNAPAPSHVSMQAGGNRNAPHCTSKILAICKAPSSAVVATLMSASGRSSGSRVARMPRLPNPLDQWPSADSSPVTAAGPLPICTGFPIKPQGHLYLISYLPNPFPSVNGPMHFRNQVVSGHRTSTILLPGLYTPSMTCSKKFGRAFDIK